MRYYLLVTSPGDLDSASAAMRYDTERVMTQRWAGVGWEDAPSMIEYIAGDARAEAIEVAREDVEAFLGTATGL